MLVEIHNMCYSNLETDLNQLWFICKPHLRNWSEPALIYLQPTFEKLIWTSFDLFANHIWETDLNQLWFICNPHLIFPFPQWSKNTNKNHLSSQKDKNQSWLKAEILQEFNFFKCCNLGYQINQIAFANFFIYNWNFHWKKMCGKYLKKIYKFCFSKIEGGVSAILRNIEGLWRKYFLSWLMMWSRFQ